MQASTYYGKGSPEQIERMCEVAATLFRQAGDKFGLAHVIAGLASAAIEQGDARRATALFKESLELARDVGDKWGVSSLLGRLGSISLTQGNYEEAMRYFEEGLSLSNEIGNILSVSVTLYNLALAAQGKGEYERAAELYAEGLRACADRSWASGRTAFPTGRRLQPFRMSLLTMMITSEKATQKSTTFPLRSVHQTNFLWALCHKPVLSTTQRFVAPSGEDLPFWEISAASPRSARRWRVASES